ncbi:MAG: hypothetical protein HC942_08590 [Microcoleus sp. SU_5_6]|nr:hypothetical protein [Microcoleus sp. SU_5_6]
MLPTATTTLRATRTGTGVFALLPCCSFLLPRLPCEHSSQSELADGNLLGVQEESRPVPAMGVTSSENKTEPGSLVGMPKSCPVSHILLHDE